MELTRVIKYLYAIVHLPPVIGRDESGILLWFIDAMFMVHNDMHSHTGDMLTFEISFRKGAVFALSNNKKGNYTS